MAVSLSSIFGFYPVFLSRFLVSLFFFRLPRSGAPFLTANQSILGMCIVELVDYCILLYVRQGLEKRFLTHPSPRQNQACPLQKVDGPAPARQTWGVKAPALS